MQQQKITVTLLGPSLTGVGGISTHTKQIFYSVLAEELHLIFFQVGSEGREESVLLKLMRYISSPIEFFWLLFKSKPQIIHVNTSICFKGFWRDLAYLCIARIMKKRIIYQIHGGQLPQDFFKTNRVLANFFRWILRSNDVVVVLLGQAELIAYQKFSPDLHLEVIPNAIEIGADPQWKKSRSDHDRPLKLIYMGRLIRAKGVFEIIEALKILIDFDKNIQLIIAGSGPDELMLRTVVEDMGLNGVVSFLGAVFDEKKNRVWEEADLFVFPTYFNEGLPYALLESMAARTPPLICSVGVIADVIQDSVQGCFVPIQNAEALANEILRLDKDRALISDMGEACRQRILEHYTIDRMIGDFRQTYLNLLRNEN